MPTDVEYEEQILALQQKLEAHHLADSHALRRAHTTLTQHVAALKAEAGEFELLFSASFAPLGCLGCFHQQQQDELRQLRASWRAIEERIDIMSSLTTQQPAPSIAKATRD